MVRKIDADRWGPRKALADGALLVGDPPLMPLSYGILLVAGSLLINPAALTITADSGLTSIYGNAIVPLTYSESGLYLGDSITGALATTASPTASERPDQSTGFSGSPNEKVSVDSPASVSLCQSRPSLPRPAVCRSATNRIGSGRPARARRINSVLVESTSGNISTVKPGSKGATCSQMASAGQRMVIVFRAWGLKEFHGTFWCRTSRGTRP